MNLESVFDENVEELGGRFRVEEKSPEVQAGYKLITDQANELIGSAREAIPELPHIHFDYILNGNVNAVAFRRSGHYFIGIHTGTIFLLRLIIGRMLSDQSLFLSVGNPKDEAGDLSPIKGYSLDADDLYIENPILSPRNEERRVYGSAVMDFALTFLLGHEIAHITRGHLDYVASKSHASFISEICFHGLQTEELMLERQAIECDADQRSVASRVDSLRLTSLHASLPSLLNSQDPRHMLIQLWAVALNITFRLFGDIKFTKQELRNSPYPPLSMRRIMAGLSTLTNVEYNWDRELKDVTMEIFQKAYSTVENAFGVILDADISTESMGSALTHQSHMEDIVNYWNNVVRIKCQKFAYEF